jgi:hypothetical protein
MKPLILTATFYLSVITSIYAQEDTVSLKSNLVKINVTSLPFKNISLQYERILNKKISVAISGRIMPTSSVPFRNIILESASDDPDTKEAIESLRINTTAITPEVRFYLGKKGYGQGFYLASFYRYATFEGSDMKFDYTTSLGAQNSIFLAGKLTAHTGGILLGTQWLLGNRFCLDVWWFGPHYGVGNGTFSGTTSVPLTAFEQNEIKQELEDLDIPLTKKTITVNASGASMKLDGPWGGVRAGASLGLRF